MASRCYGKCGYTSITLHSRRTLMKINSLGVTSGTSTLGYDQLKFMFHSLCRVFDCLQSVVQLELRMLR